MTSRHKRNHVNGSHYHHTTMARQQQQHGDLMAYHSDHMSHPHDRVQSQQRHRRDLSKCTSTHKQRRRLSIGCSRDDIFEVSPQCSETGDEGTGNLNFFLSSLSFQHLTGAPLRRYFSYLLSAKKKFFRLELVCSRVGVCFV